MKTIPVSPTLSQGAYIHLLRGRVNLSFEVDKLSSWSFTRRTTCEVGFLPNRPSPLEAIKGDGLVGKKLASLDHEITSFKLAHILGLQMVKPLENLQTSSSLT